MSSVLPLRLPSRPLLLALAIAAAPFTAIIPANAQTTEAVSAQIRFDIAPGHMTDALNRFASTAGITLSFDPDAISNLRSDGLQGSFSVDEALHRLLSGSGLQTQRTTSGAYLVVPEPVKTEKVGPTLSAVKVSAAVLNEATEGSNSYTIQSFGKTGETLREIPRSVSVITRQQLDDQHLVSFEEAMEQLPGVTVTRSDGWGAGGISVRGYDLTSILVDGAPARGMSEGDTSFNTGMAKYDNIQLLRGPDALFSGNSQPSGSVNLVRKRPKDSFQLVTTASAGSWQNYLGEVDVSTPITVGGNIRGRVVASYNDTEKFYDDAHRKSSTLYGIVETNLAENTVISAGASLDRRTGQGSDHATAFPRFIDGTPLELSRNIGLPAFSHRDSDSLNYFATLEHNFSANWTSKLNYSRTESDGNTFLPYYNGAVNPLTGLGSTFFRWAELYNWESESDAVDASLSGSFQLLERDHRIVVGANRLETHGEGNIQAITSGLAGVQIDWNTFDPRSLTSYTAAAASSFRDNKQTQEGLYTYGSFQLQGALRLVLGGRYATYENIDARYRLPNKPNPVVNESDDIFTPYYALVYDVNSYWTVFFSAAESYEDQSNLYSENDKPLNPTSGNSFELGIKGEHADGRINSHLTFYRSTRENYAVKVSDNEDFDVAGKACCYRGDGEFLSQGVEFDISGEMLPNWQINAGYTYNDNEVEYGTASGQSFSTDKPEHIFRLWSRYSLTGALTGLSLGGGINAQSSFFKTGTVPTWNATGGESGTGAWNGPAVPYSFMEPGRTITNLFAQYQFASQWNATININNLFDKHYFQQVGSTNGGNVYGEPRNIMFTVRGTFN